ncbi:hypothetical protein [Methylobacterium sp. Leaf106]|uniref:hypothetical protein n=1 Tax=Methylobacterium sp. Leaf106 TaxID=1736255 RepID=UPI0012E8CFE5|nr:hypothetical protein [Methylobacterium sp. Leaf106]
MGEKKQKAAWARPNAEIVEALTHQVGFMRSSCRAYDKGSLQEAQRLASAVYIIVVDGGQRSLLTQLSARRDLQFFDSTYADDPRNLSEYMPMILMRVGGLNEKGDIDCKYVPVVNGPMTSGENVKFVDWWERRIIFDDKRGNALTRRSIVRALRSQDGGSHFDEHLTDPAYVALSRENAPGWGFGVDGDISTPFPPGAHLAMMRVIAWELEKTLVDGQLLKGPVETGTFPAPE